MPLPMPEEEEEHFRCPHGERNQALMLCSLNCDLSGAHPDRKAKADGRFIITPWCDGSCRTMWFGRYRCASCARRMYRRSSAWCTTGLKSILS